MGYATDSDASVAEANHCLTKSICDWLKMAPWDLCTKRVLVAVGSRHKSSRADFSQAQSYTLYLQFFNILCMFLDIELQKGISQHIIVQH